MNNLFENNLDFVFIAVLFLMLQQSDMFLLLVTCSMFPSEFVFSNLLSFFLCLPAKDDRNYTGKNFLFLLSCLTIQCYLVWHGCTAANLHWLKYSRQSVNYQQGWRNRFISFNKPPTAHMTLRHTVDVGKDWSDMNLLCVIFTGKTIVPRPKSPLNFNQA